MKSKREGTPGRREFMRRLGTAAVYGAPVVAVLGAASPRSNPEQIAVHFREAARHLNEAYQLGRRTEFTPRDWEMLKPAIDGVRRPILGFPPEWCTIC